MDGQRWTRGCWIVLLGCLITPSLALAETTSHTVQVTATILPRLELTVTPSTGASIAFGAMTQPAQGEEASRTVAVNVSVFSNLDRPYHVTQVIRHPLTSALGSTIPDEQFLVSTRGAAIGEARVTASTPIVPGEVTTLYTSNARGKSDAFAADYTLEVTPVTPAGDFATAIIYTVTSL